MKKKLKIFFISMLCFIIIGIQITFLGLGIYILDGLTYLYRHPGLLSEGTINVMYAFVESEIINIEDNILYVKPIRDYEKFVTNSKEKREGYEFLQTDILAINLDNTIVKCDLDVGKIVFVNYKFVDGKSGKNPIYLNTVEYINDKQE